MRLLGGILALAVGLGGQPSRGRIEGHWEVVELNQRRIPFGVRAPTVDLLRGGELRGFAGCNGIGGSYRRKGRVLEIGMLTATRMACVGEAMQMEDEFLRTFAGGMNMMLGETTLVLSRGDKKIRLVRSTRP